MCVSVCVRSSLWPFFCFVCCFFSLFDSIAWFYLCENHSYPSIAIYFLNKAHIYFHIMCCDRKQAQLSIRYECTMALDESSVHHMHLIHDHDFCFLFLRSFCFPFSSAFFKVVVLCVIGRMSFSFCLFQFSLRFSFQFLLRSFHSLFVVLHRRDNIIVGFLSIFPFLNKVIFFYFWSKKPPYL